MIGLGLGGFGGSDDAITHVGISGGDAYIGWMRSLNASWQRHADDMNKATKAAGAYAHAMSKAKASGGGLNSRSFMQGGGTLTGAMMAASGGMLGTNSRIGMGLSNAMSGSAIAMMLAAGKNGMDTFESEDMVKQVFGSRTGDINKWSSGLSDRLGFNQFETRRNAAQFQTQFTAGGMDEAGAAQMSKAYTQAARDIISFYNVKDEREAFAALQSGINGESEPLRKYSVYLSDAATKEYAYKNGIAAANSELTEQQKLQARAGFILKSFREGKAFNNAEITKDSPANRLRAQQNQLAEQFSMTGMALMPLAGDALKLTNQLIPPVREAVKWFSSLDETSRRWMLGLAVVLPQATRLVGLFKGAKDVFGAGKSITGLGLGGGNCCCGTGGGLGTQRLPGGANPAPPWWKTALGWKALAPEAGATGTMARLLPAGLSAFGMGTAGTAGIIAAGGVAAYKLPGYMRDATHKSDEDMSASSDPLQRVHGFASRKLSETTWYKRLTGVSALDEFMDSTLEKRRKELFGRLEASNKRSPELKWLDAQKGKDGVIAPRRAEPSDVVENVWDKRTKAISEMFFGPDDESSGTRKVRGNASRTRSGGVQVSYEIPSGPGEAVARNLNFLVNTPGRAAM